MAALTHSERLAVYDTIPDPDEMRRKRLQQVERYIDAAYIKAALRIVNERISSAIATSCRVDVPLNWLQKEKLMDCMTLDEWPSGRFETWALLVAVRDKIADRSPRYRVKIKETVLRIKWN
jgi:hypothetical protein